METVGVVVRTLNESELIGTCLDALRGQALPVDLDIVVVDSGSTDGTVEIARERGARVVELPPERFDYSTALNLGIEEARGETILSLSAHAVPIGDGWLETMLAPLADPGVAAVGSRQVPWAGAPWQEVYRLGQQFGESSRVYTAENADEVVFSNASSAIRRSVWAQYPFLLPAAEDLEWARRVLSAGWFIVYEAGASVYHSHRESPRAQARRLIDLGHVRPPTRERGHLGTLRDAGGLVVRDSRKILALDEPARRKLAYLAELLRVAFYYVMDYSSRGTTAEHLRGEATRAPRARPPDS